MQDIASAERVAIANRGAIVNSLRVVQFLLGLWIDVHASEATIKRLGGWWRDGKAIALCIRVSVHEQCPQYVNPTRTIQLFATRACPRKYEENLTSDSISRGNRKEFGQFPRGFSLISCQLRDLHFSCMPRSGKSWVVGYVLTLQFGYLSLEPSKSRRQASRSGTVVAPFSSWLQSWLLLCPWPLSPTAQSGSDRTTQQWNITKNLYPWRRWPVSVQEEQGRIANETKTKQFCQCCTLVVSMTLCSSLFGSFGSFEGCFSGVSLGWSVPLVKIWSMERVGRRREDRGRAKTTCPGCSNHEKHDISVAVAQWGACLTVEVGVARLQNEVAPMSFWISKRNVVRKRHETSPNTSCPRRKTDTMALKRLANTSLLRIHAAHAFGLVPIHKALLRELFWYIADATQVHENIGNDFPTNAYQWYHVFDGLRIHERILREPPRHRPRN